MNGAGGHLVNSSKLPKPAKLGGAEKQIDYGLRQEPDSLNVIHLLQLEGVGFLDGVKSLLGFEHEKDLHVGGELPELAESGAGSEVEQAHKARVLQVRLQFLLNFFGT